jgi:hypothetical protein
LPARADAVAAVRKTPDEPVGNAELRLARAS